MAVKKSELYRSLWAGCDELRGSMDASQYKDYVLVMLFMKYVSDKVKREKEDGKSSLIEIPEGASFYDMLKYRGQSDIGNKINMVIGEFAKANGLTGIITEADFNDEAKLGTGKDKIDLLTNLVNIFNRDELDFSRNRAEGDDLLGDAYEYLMRHFATESGKSKGQFYTPAEVSRIIAQVIDIDQSTSQSQTLYDPACGSGSLLLKAADLAPKGISLYGQENDNATRALAVMNMWLHNFADADIQQGNTMASPLFTDDTTGELKTFDYAVANPPFSYKKWMNGLNPTNDIYKRFDGYAIPPKKNGDFAFLLHLIKSLKSKGKACIVLPLGVLFRGSAEAGIRKRLVQQGYIKGIIGLPPNLFYGTGIAASLVIIDKENASSRKSIFMIDASRGFIKDGNKNRLREQDIHKIVDAFKKRITTDPKYARDVSITEIAGPKNDYNLNIPRYIDSQEEEDIQDIDAHLFGGIPVKDIEALKNYWQVYPTLKADLFATIKGRKNYYKLKKANDAIKDSIFNHAEFTAFGKKMDKVFNQWKAETIAYTRNLKKDLQPKLEIHFISENLLKHYDNKKLTDQYAMYQHLMDYWAKTMQDDFYELAVDGWEAGNEVKRMEKKTKKGDNEIVKQVAGLEGLEGRLISPALIIQEYFVKEQKVIDKIEAEIEALKSKQEEILEEHTGEDGLMAEVMDEKGKVNKVLVQKRLKDLKPAKVKKVDEDNKEEYDLLETYFWLLEEEIEKNKKVRNHKIELEYKVIAQYPKLSIEEIKTLVVEKKWMAEMEVRIRTEMDNISHRLTQRIKELAERYETPLPQLNDRVNAFTKKVNAHLKKMNSKKATRQGAIEELLKPKDNWVEKLLGNSATLKARIGWQGLTTAEYRESGNYLLITGTDFKNGFIDWDNCVYVDENRYEQDKNIQIKEHDILVTKDGTIGKVALIKSLPKPATLNSGVFVIRPLDNSFYPDFFYYLLLSEVFLKFLSQLSAGSTINHLYQKDFVSFSFRVPKEIKEQQRIAQILSDMDTEMEALEQKLKKQRQIKQGMMQLLLTGKSG